MRRGPVKKRIIEPDLEYSSTLVSRLINYVMEEGKKDIARKIVYGAMKIAEKKLIFNNMRILIPKHIVNVSSPYPLPRRNPIQVIRAIIF